jgi:ATP-binding protein involved in chromosome partitioning
VTVEPVRDDLHRLYRALADAFGGQVEVRTPTRVFRGGHGFGEGKHLIAVLGGKGGVGKSTVATNLGITLSAMGMAVGLLDGDINAPDMPQMLGIRPAELPKRAMRTLFGQAIPPPSRRQRPVARHGLESWSVGFVTPEGLPPAWTGRLLIAGLLRHLVFDVGWNADVLLIDAPPGTGDEIQSMVRDLPLSGAVFVTTPQDLAQMDAERTLTLLQEHEIPVIGMVQNMAGLTCPHCGEPIDLYSASARLEDAGVRILGRVPFDVQLSVSADHGIPLVLGNPTGPVALEFARIGAAVRRWLHASADA